MINATPPPAHNACGPKLKNGDQLCANRPQCDFWFRHNGQLYRAFSCAEAYPRRKK